MVPVRLRDGGLGGNSQGCDISKNILFLTKVGLDLSVEQKTGMVASKVHILSKFCPVHLSETLANEEEHISL